VSSTASSSLLVSVAFLVTAREEHADDGRRHREGNGHCADQPPLTRARLLTAAGTGKGPCEPRDVVVPRLVAQLDSLARRERPEHVRQLVDVR
jgi:hypothetical protein